MTLIKESIDKCEICGIKDNLANGLCIKCWDKKKDTRSVLTKTFEIRCNTKLLSKREIQVCKLVSEGYSDILIAEKLKLSKKTINSHLCSIYLKLIIPIKINKRVWISLNYNKIKELNK